LISLNALLVSININPETTESNTNIGGENNNDNDSVVILGQTRTCTYCAYACSFHAYLLHTVLLYLLECVGVLLFLRYVHTVREWLSSTPTLLVLVVNIIPAFFKWHYFTVHYCTGVSGTLLYTAYMSTVKIKYYSIMHHFLVLFNCLWAAGGA
jgi:hypothetical protein